MDIDVSDITTPAFVVVSFRCPAALKDAIEAQAKVELSTASQIIRRAAAYDLAARSGAGRDAL